MRRGKESSLDQALERLRRGAGAAEALAAADGHGSELEPLVRRAAELRSAPAPECDEAARSAARLSLLSAVAERKAATATTPAPWYSRWTGRPALWMSSPTSAWRGALIAFLLFLGGGGAVAAAATDAGGIRSGVAGVFTGSDSGSGPSNEALLSEEELNGTVLAVDAAAGTITLDVDGQEVTVQVTADTTLRDGVDLATLQPGDVIQVHGSFDENGVFVATDIEPGGDLPAVAPDDEDEGEDGEEEGGEDDAQEEEQEDDNAGPGNAGEEDEDEEDDHSGPSPNAGSGNADEEDEDEEDDHSGPSPNTGPGNADDDEDDDDNSGPGSAGDDDEDGDADNSGPGSVSDDGDDRSGSGSGGTDDDDEDEEGGSGFTNPDDESDDGDS